MHAKYKMSCLSGSIVHYTFTVSAIIYNMHTVAHCSYMLSFPLFIFYAYAICTWSTYLDAHLNLCCVFRYFFPPQTTTSHIINQFFSRLISCSLGKSDEETVCCVWMEPVHCFLVAVHLTVCRWTTITRTVFFNWQDLKYCWVINQIWKCLFENLLESCLPKILRDNNRPACWFSHHSALPELQWNKKHCIRYRRSKQ